MPKTASTAESRSRRFGESITVAHVDKSSIQSAPFSFLEHGLGSLGPSESASRVRQ